MHRTLIFIFTLLNCGLTANVSQAQLFRGNAAPPAAREPARVGLLGGIREAREERFRREEQAAAAAARAAAAQRSAAISPRSVNPGSQPPNNVARNNAQRRDATANPLSSSPSANSPAATTPASKGEPNSRTANFRGPSGVTPVRGQENGGSTNSKISSNNMLSRPTPATSSAAVTAASASAFVPAPLGNDGPEYDGPGVAIRLPKEAPSVVNFLVDETNTSAIRPGEEQVLDGKGSYVVRYSRGVTREGRSFGESRYTITEGRYRFELTATGWELFREPDAETNVAPPNPLGIADSPIADRPSAELLSPEPSLQSELQRPLATAKPEAVPNKPTTEPSASEPVPASNEEVLPAPKPRSILE